MPKTTKKPRTKPAKKVAADQSNGAPPESETVATAVAEPPAEDLSPPTTPVEMPEVEKAEEKPAAPEDKDKDKDRIASSLNIAKLQSMSMSELNQMARD